MTLSWNTLENDAQDGTVVNLSTAYLDADDEKDFSASINGLWHRVELGYIYAHNNIDRFNTAGVNDNCNGECQLLYPGHYDIHTVHTSGTSRILWICPTSIFILGPMRHGWNPLHQNPTVPTSATEHVFALNICSKR
jgi:hypothetical protein